MKTHPLSLYIHIPFCDHRCAYCDFNAYAGLDRLMPRYTDALVTEIAAWGAAMGRRAVPTVFFGGGTPSLLPLPLLERVIDAVRLQFAVDPTAEWTLEANPGTVDEAYLRGLRALGVNRVSIGVQSFDDGELRRLDRIHDAATAEHAYRAARSAGFANVNLDLIYGLEGQDLTGWERNLDRALDLGPEHLSLYALTIEEGTPLAHRVARGHAPEPDPDLQADLYELAQDRLAAAGHEHYEISNWAKPGYACRHNLAYWRDGEWLGLGAGAHSHLDGRRFAVMNSPAGYVRTVLGGDRPAPQPYSPWQAGAGTRREGALLADDHRPWPPSSRRGEKTGMRGDRFPWLAFLEDSDPATEMNDAVVMALRLSEGLALAGFESRFGRSFDDVYDGAVAELAALGLLERADGRVRIAERGRLLANEVFARLLAAQTEGTPVIPPTPAGVLTR